MAKEGLGRRIASSEIAIYVARGARTAEAENRRGISAAGFAAGFRIIETGLFESGESVMRKDIRPHVAIISGGISTREDMGESSEHVFAIDTGNEAVAIFGFGFGGECVGEP